MMIIKCGDRQADWWGGFKWAEDIVKRLGCNEGERVIDEVLIGTIDKFDRGALDYLHTDVFKVNKIAEECTN